MKRASFGRRLVASTLESLPGLLCAAVMVALGVLPDDAVRVPPDWFWTDWLVQLWIERATAIVVPTLWAALLGTASTTAFEWAGLGPSRWLGLEVVDADGRQPSTWRFGLRWIGACINVATFGLGWAWALVSRHGRGWHDIVSGTAVYHT